MLSRKNKYKQNNNSSLNKSIITSRLIITIYDLYILR